MKSEDEHFAELAKKWGPEEILAERFEEPKPFWVFMAGWPERGGFKRPLDVLKTLSNSESAGQSHKEAATFCSGMHIIMITPIRRKSR